MQFLHNLYELSYNPYIFITNTPLNFHQLRSYDNDTCEITKQSLEKFSVGINCNEKTHFFNYRSLADRVNVLCPCNNVILPHAITLYEKQQEKFTESDNVIGVEITLKEVTIEQQPNPELVDFLQSRINKSIAVFVNGLHWTAVALSFLVQKTILVASVGFSLLQKLIEKVGSKVDYFVKFAVSTIVAPAAVPYILFGGGVLFEEDPTRAQRSISVFNTLYRCTPGTKLLSTILRTAVVASSLALTLAITAGVLVLPTALTVSSVAIATLFTLNLFHNFPGLKRPALTPSEILQFSDRATPMPICKYRTPESEERILNIRNADIHETIVILRNEIVWNFPELNNS